MMERRLLFSFILALVVVSGCGKPSGPVQSEAIPEAWEKYRMAEFDRAIRMFNTIRFSADSEDLRVQALYGEACCWNHRRDKRDPAKAQLLYQQILEEAPKHELAPWSALDLVRVRASGPLETRPGPGLVAEEYLSVSRKYPKSPAGDEAFLHGQTVRLPEADETETGKILEEVRSYIDTHSQSPFLSPLYRLAAQCCEQLGRQRERLEYLIRASETRETVKGLELIDRTTDYWQIAYVAQFELGDFALARTYYSRLIEEYPQDVRVFAARKSLAAMTAMEEDIRREQALSTASGL